MTCYWILIYDWSEILEFYHFIKNIAHNCVTDNIKRNSKQIKMMAFRALKRVNTDEMY